MRVRLAISFLVLVLVLAAPVARAETVDLLLALVTDVSRSIDEEEYALQKQGYVTAFTDPRVVAAIKGGVVGAIAVSYIEFAGGGEVKTVIGWTVIRDAASARAFATSIQEASRSFIGRTAISSGMQHAMREIAAAPHVAERRVIDVCGDGTSNSGPPLAEVRSAALAAGITVNGLVILSEPNWPGNEAHVRPPGGLRKYYEENVIGGIGSFAMEANDFQSFGIAMTRKLVTEISDLQLARAKKWVAR
jgi:hypothetical protein